jgi:uncharacterized membrane protein
MLAPLRKLRRHLRKVMLAGLLAAVPVIVVIWAAVMIETQTRPVARLAGLDFPGLGVLLVILSVYLLGVVVTSFLGGFFLAVLDKVLEHIPGFRYLYHAWKDVVLLPPAKSSMFHQVVLVPSSDGKSAQFGFTSGEALPGEPAMCCVFLPNVPNPLTGRLMLFERSTCVPLDLSVAEAFKFLLSTANYIPAHLHGAGRQLGREPRAPACPPRPPEAHG